ncbi:hypothetical protein [Rubinisphaera sp.]|uniref:hypothetical protein n=1 Tax=Rubinisphaera sp. TaxID=2024857 RepID=UPI000C12217B|nr:hypothetical protein [Rubinisphaera sp.]MBV08375.1 hypothetical protein [Rubinisphaera sp.]|tara:strand:+ start:7848 stop:8720 length:873 start_codon:yes stop_codon:yes gene_type:complete
MSLIGKFFVVMQILLSVTFMGFAATVFTYQADWKGKAEAEQKAKQQVQTEKDNLQAEFDKYKADTTSTIAAAEDRAERAESANSALQLNLTDAKMEKERLANALQSQTALVKIAEDEAEARRTEAMAQRVVNKELHEKLTDRIAKSLESEDKLYNLRIEKDNLVNKNKNLIEQQAFLEKVVRNNNLETDPRIYNAQNEPPPIVNGLVINAAVDDRGAVDLVEVSLGSDDGLVKGHRLEVWRSGLLEDGGEAKYLGQIELVFVDSDHAVGKVVQKAKNGIIKRGDNVTSKL